MEKKDLRKFAIILAIICVVLSALWIRKGSERLHLIFFGIAGYSVLSAIFYPHAIRPVHILLTEIAHVIGWFNTRLLLGIIFYFILTPIGLFLRIFGKDFLNVKIKGDEKTYWVPKGKEALDPKGYENQF